MQKTMKTLGGRLTVPRCQATAKRTGNQCAQPALAGHECCRFHQIEQMVTQIPNTQEIIAAEDEAYELERKERSDRWERMLQWAVKQFRTPVIR